MKNKKTEKIPLHSSRECRECGNLISKAITSNREASDYAMGFCGLDCYEHWAKVKKAKGSLNDSNS